jgi:hypothetical protein
MRTYDLKHSLGWIETRSAASRAGLPIYRNDPHGQGRFMHSQATALISRPAFHSRLWDRFYAHSIEFARRLIGEAKMMSGVDPWQQAAECDRLLKTTNDRRRRAILEHLRNRWIALGNHQAMLSEDEIAKEIELIGRIYAGLIPEQRIVH